MKVLVTGATGFVGQHVVPRLLERDHQVVALARNAERAKSFSWFEQITFVPCDIHQPSEALFARLDSVDAVMHLAWSGLPNYKELFHFEENLLADYNFLKQLILRGVRQVLVTGTCFEYGMQSGALSEQQTTEPTNPYGFAKDTLRKFLQFLQQKQPFTLQWARLFYMYGEGQNPRSLLSQLDAAIDRGERVFPMSGGEQLCDYLPVEEVARRLVLLLEHPDLDGVTNICDGAPTSVRRLVEQHLEKRGVTMELDLGFYPYPDYVPMAFWGESGRMKKVIDQE